MTSNHHQNVMTGSTPATTLGAPKQRSGVMNFYIKEWTDNTATLMTERGRVVWTFASAKDAEEAARDYERTQDRRDGAAEKKPLTIRTVAQ
jgi:hypothetical protein